FCPPRSAREKKEMEKWSFQRIRELMTRIALRGMAANELGRARISMMVRSMSSNTRPDTLVQDPTLQPHRFLLQRTAGPYIRVITRRRQHIRIRSASPQSTDIDDRRRRVAFVPEADSCSATTTVAVGPRAARSRASISRPLWPPVG